MWKGSLLVTIPTFTFNFRLPRQLHEIVPIPWTLRSLVGRGIVLMRVHPTIHTGIIIVAFPFNSVDIHVYSLSSQKIPRNYRFDSVDTLFVNAE